MDDKTYNRLMKHFELQETQEFIDLDRHRYRSRYIEMINEAIDKNPRVVVTLGCSFAFGQASYTDEMMAKVRPKGHGRFSDFDYVFKDHDIKDLLDLAEEYKLRIQTRHHHGDMPENWMNHSEGEFELVTKNMETNNSFGNKIADYADYVPVNFSQNGNGNQASVNRLFSYPIDWDKCEEIIVLWSYTDATRNDMLNDQGLSYDEIGNDHKTMWPQFQEYDPELEKFHTGNTWHACQATWTRTCWSELYNYINFINAGIKIKTWCKAYNARLVTFPAFVCVNKPTIEDYYCRTRVVRDVNQILLPVDGIQTDFQMATWEFDANMKALHMFPWDTVWEPGGYDSFYGLAMAQEDNCDIPVDQVIGVGTPNDWILPCGHPSGKGHDKIAEKLIEHLDL